MANTMYGNNHKAKSWSILQYDQTINKKKNIV